MTHCITNHAHKILHLYPLLFIHFMFLDKASWACFYHFFNKFQDKKYFKKQRLLYAIYIKSIN